MRKAKLQRLKEEGEDAREKQRLKRAGRSELT
jgi:hypothetical protein